MYSGYTQPDPFALNDSLSQTSSIYRYTTGVSPRQVTINPAQKTLVLIVAGQSLATSILPTLYLPSSDPTISHLNIYDGAFYPVTAPLLGTNWTPSLGTGNIIIRLADKFVTNGKFNQVLPVVVNVGGVPISEFAAGGTLYDRTAIAMRRLAAKGITPATTGVTFAFLWMQGEQERGLGTTQAAYAAGLASVDSALTAAGFIGRRFYPKETYSGGLVYSPVQLAQVAFVDNVTRFSGGDLDAITANRVDGTHPGDSDGALIATALYNAMVATGAPF